MSFIVAFGYQSTKQKAIEKMQADYSEMPV
jgi:hypothetical protein